MTSASSSLHRFLTFILATLCVVICFAASSFPVPLIAMWTQVLSFSTFEVTMTVFAYVGGCLAVLLFFSRLSNALGRKRTVMLSLILGIVSCFCFVNPESASTIIWGRFLQGLYAGLTTSAAMSWTVDTTPKSHTWLGTTLSSAGPGIGFTFGTILVGFLAQGGAAAVNGLFEGLSIALVGVLICTYFALETISPGTQSIVEVLRPKFGVSEKAKSVFPLCVVGFIGTWALTCFFQGFSAMLGSEVFTGGVPSPAYAALTYLLLIGPNALGGILCGKLNPQKMLFPLATTYFITGTLTFVAASYALPAVFIGALSVCGFVMGGICSLSLKLLLKDAALTERAQTISSLYLAGYLGTGIPSFIIGTFVTNATVPVIGLVFFGWFLLIWVATALFQRRLYRAQECFS